MSLAQPPRHHFVWLRPGTLSLQAGDGEALAIAQDWIGDGRPLIARRRGPDDDNAMALGLSLPSRLGRRRLALRVEAPAILRVAPPPLLAALLPTLDETWCKSSREILSRAQSCGADLQVFGSAAWQWLTGEVYMHSASDLDLLVQPLTGWRHDKGLHLFAEMAASRNPVMDGEVCVGPDENVSWRELLLPTREVLLRTSKSLELCLRSDIERRLEEAPRT